MKILKLSQLLRRKSILCILPQIFFLQLAARVKPDAIDKILNRKLDEPPRAGNELSLTGLIS